MYCMYDIVGRQRCHSEYQTDIHNCMIKTNMYIQRKLYYYISIIKFIIEVCPHAIYSVHMHRSNPPSFVSSRYLMEHVHKVSYTVTIIMYSTQRTLITYCMSIEGCINFIFYSYILCNHIIITRQINELDLYMYRPWSHY